LTGLVGGSARAEQDGEQTFFSVPGTPGRRRKQLVARRSGVRW
jgi:hypothetical protein